ncbi:hypothetical protein [Iningainema tapete]|uniref:Uncharacterized protein n=1 Tax=Iningainema tapete BLCC-T55 TaxID=2748662 RepID=A0A8J7BYU3_9CYAN|nr:hypothetical protein [Iningainema tapete]MBD2774648.1 hypothetical protein [Iningainema tapete BLCC-T55]
MPNDLMSEKAYLEVNGCLPNIRVDIHRNANVCRDAPSGRLYICVRSLIYMINSLFERQKSKYLEIFTVQTPHRGVSTVKFRG